MAEKITLRISAAAAPYVGPKAPREAKLQAAAGRVQLPPVDLVILVYFLYHDPDPEVKRTALATLHRLDIPFLVTVLSDRELHPRLLDVLAKLHYAKAELATLLASHPMLDAATAAFLAQKGVGSAGEAAEDEDFQSKYQLLQTLGVAEKIKLALTGDKEWRNLLIKDANKLVSSAVIKNPRITDAEVLAIAKSAVQNDEIMRVICSNKEWVKNYQIRKALVENHKTPLPAAIRYVATLTEKDLSALARSKNVSSVVVSQARKILSSKKNGR